MEKNYDFRKRLLEVHRRDRRDLSLDPAPDELALDDNSDIVIPTDAGRVLVRAAQDLQDYLFTSMGVSVRVIRTDNLREAISGEDGEGCIVYATKAHEPDVPLQEGNAARGFRIDCTDRIIITGFDEAGAMQGGFWLEDLMNFRRAPFLKKASFSRAPLFSPRMTHSGYGLDHFPDQHLAAIAHAGMDSLLVFVKDVDLTPYGYLDFNELCHRAAEYGLDVYAYSYLVSRMHPEDPGAEQVYDRLYGAIFEACPLFKGIVMVGESVEFPSRDPRTTGQSYLTPTPDGLPRTKPSPGWWPCEDFPQWVSLVRDSVRRYKPDADIVFWTYNWGYAPEEVRLRLLDNLPTNITLLVTFEMFELIETGPIVSTTVDYTLMFEGPGAYFVSEAKRAKERGLRLYSMVNTGGLTWDVGVVPYEPTPGQWMRRLAAVLDCRGKYGLCGLMESHHYGFWPSFISDLVKWTYTAGTPEPGQTLAMLAEREFGKPNAEKTLRAWELWSEGIRHYVSTNEDQYGPFRIGPSFPLVLNSAVRVPESPFAMFGNRIFNTMYGNSDSGRCSLMSFRLDHEIESLGVMRDRFREGADLLQETLSSLDTATRESAELMIGLGRFIGNSAETTVHVKQWFKAKQMLLSATDKQTAEQALARLGHIAEAEILNAENTIPLVQRDSRLGWEPSMEYMCDEKHLRWKIKQVKQVIESELQPYRNGLHFVE